MEIVNKHERGLAEMQLASICIHSIKSAARAPAYKFQYHKAHIFTLCPEIRVNSLTEQSCGMFQLSGNVSQRNSGRSIYNVRNKPELEGSTEGGASRAGGGQPELGLSEAAAGFRMYATARGKNNPVRD